MPDYVYNSVQCSGVGCQKHKGCRCSSLRLQVSCIRSAGVSYVELDNWKFSVRWPNGKATDCYSVRRKSLGGSNPPLIVIL